MSWRDEPARAGRNSISATVPSWPWPASVRATVRTGMPPGRHCSARPSAAPGSRPRQLPPVPRTRPACIEVVRLDVFRDENTAYATNLSRAGVPSPIGSGCSSRSLSVALAWLLQRSPNILLIPGTSSTAHLRENITGTGLSLSHEDLTELDDIGR
ncbi:hypothetical protein QFZ49_007095 [Streptomyces turgidiscabies]|uniref:NADP-dependent oxidoreductase domain-containing protein n=1 Tax=Streptomyces turgidiscabies TaxID=85558 RepID=A0ABU0RYP6_9ACTN|nr:hypothetical protein [Streptomyces turgidiscabies]